MKARKVRKLLRKRRRTGESTKAAARRLSQDIESSSFIADVTTQWLRNKKPVRVANPRTNHAPKKEEAAPPPKPTKGGRNKK